MRYLILSDIHSNAEALEKCLQTAQGRYDETLCLGDLVGYGPDPNSVVDRIRDIARVILRGNHDKACCGITRAEDFNPLARLATLWTRHELTPEHAEFLRNLPMAPEALAERCLVGPAQECIEKLAKFVEAGCSKFVLRPSCPTDQVLSQVDAYARDILPHFGS